MSQLEAHFPKAWSDETRRRARHVLRRRRRRLDARTAAVAIPAAALGAAAMGALAIGALAIGRLAVRSARIGRLEIDELVLPEGFSVDRPATKRSGRSRR